MAGIYKRNRRPRHNFPSCENRIFPFAFFNVSALLEPEQPNACGRFCCPRPRCWSPNSRTPAAVFAALAAEDRPAPPAQQPSHWWILPSPLPPIGDSRKKTTAQEKESCWILLLLAPAAVGASLRSPLAMGGEPPSFRAFRAFGLPGFGLSGFGLRAA